MQTLRFICCSTEEKKLFYFSVVNCAPATQPMVVLGFFLPCINFVVFPLVQLLTSKVLKKEFRKDEHTDADNMWISSKWWLIFKWHLNTKTFSALKLNLICRSLFFVSWIFAPKTVFLGQLPEDAFQNGHLPLVDCFTPQGWLLQSSCGHTHMSKCLQVRMLNIQYCIILNARYMKNIRNFLVRDK